MSAEQSEQDTSLPPYENLEELQVLRERLSAIRSGSLNGEARVRWSRGLAHAHAVKAHHHANASRRNFWRRCCPLPCAA